MSLNFTAKRGMFDTSRYDCRALIPIIKNGFRIMGARLNSSCARMSGKETINKVLAGVGSPMKELVCRVSILNLANRNAEKMVMMKGKNKSA